MGEDKVAVKLKRSGSKPQISALRTISFCNMNIILIIKLKQTWSLFILIIMGGPETQFSQKKI